MLTIAERKQIHEGNVAIIKRTIARDSARGHTAPGAVPGSRAFSRPVVPQPQPIFSEDWQDNLRPSRGVVGWSVACLAGWALFIWSVFPQ